ncbi:MAG: hypothetical protein RMM58_15455 [Chloroflexota bacterium]|nr:hypothetical protein [Dehalococcoidia bacterium]MDW8255268.1 hypothetical protein [Chloroflexota bacterium]
MDPTLTEEQQREHYRLVVDGDYVQVWHGNTQIGLLLNRAGVQEKARDLVERRRQELREVEAQTGWKWTPPPTG